MRDEILYRKIEQLSSLLKALNVKTKANQPQMVPAIKTPTLESLSVPKTKVTKLPGINPTSKKDPKNVARQLKNSSTLVPKIEVLKTAKNGQWSLEKQDSHPIKVATKLKDLTGEGTEYLIDEHGNVRAKFIDGNLPGPPEPIDAEAPTKTV